MRIENNRTDGICILLNNKETSIIVTGPGNYNYSRTIMCSGDAMKEAVLQLLKDKYKLRIGSATAEEIIREHGLAFPPESESFMKIGARRLPSNQYEVDFVSNQDVYQSLKGFVSEVTEALTTTLNNLPTEISENIFPAGIILKGNSVWLKDIGGYLQNASNITCTCEITPRPKRGIVLSN